MFNSVSSDLDPPSKLTTYVLPEETIVYDRTGKIELARFGDAKREVVTFDEIPKVLLDATTAVEDKTFWENAGFDPVAIVSAAIGSLRGDSRGASTITQQLVRNTLLETDLVQDPHRTAERKLKEIIQSIRITQAFPGVEGKQKIITAYLNQNYYGNQSYGVKAAVRSYFGIDLKDITPAQAAIIAGLPKSPVELRPRPQRGGELPDGRRGGRRVPEREARRPEDAVVVERRNQILDLLAQGRTPMSGTQYTSQDFKAAKDDEVELASQATPHWIAPHFVWAVRDELAEKLCGEDASCDALEQRRPAGHHDPRRRASRRSPRSGSPRRRPCRTRRRSTARPRPPRHSASRSSSRGWRTCATRTSTTARSSPSTTRPASSSPTSAAATTTRSSNKPDFQPQYDVVGKGYRQPGSAFKPFNYAVGIDDKAITAGTMLMDVGTDFGGGYTPSDADNLERGPVRVRNALQFSLNIPAVKTMGINGLDHVYAKAQEFGMQFKGERTGRAGPRARRPGGPAGRHGDRLRHAGQRRQGDRPHDDPDHQGRERQGRRRSVRAAGRQAGRQPAGGLHRDRHPGRQHQQEHQPVLGQVRRSPAPTAAGRRRSRPAPTTTPRTSTPTATSRHRPRTAATSGAYALAVGVWNGNSDNSLVSTAAHPLFSIDVATYVWQGFLNEATAKWPETDFARPADGLVRHKIDPFTGLQSTDSKADRRVVHRRRRAEGRARRPTRAASTSSRRSTSRRASTTG